MHAREHFEEMGYLEPVRLFDRRQCRRLKRALEQAAAPDTWNKGYAASHEAFLTLATHPGILGRVRALIGDEVMLWGAQLVVRGPWQLHPWHSDIETCYLEGTVSVWMGLENTNRHSALTVLPGSHRFGESLQDRARRAGSNRYWTTHADVRAWAAEATDDDPRAVPTTLPLGDGDALFFDGRLWHASFNGNLLRPRTAVLLQFARPDHAIRMIDPSWLESPVRWLSVPLPPCVVVSGKPDSSHNRIVMGPAVTSTYSDLERWIRDCAAPLPEDTEAGWRAWSLCHGPTPCLDELESHVSVLSGGCCPHPPHERRRRSWSCSTARPSSRWSRATAARPANR